MKNAAIIHSHLDPRDVGRFAFTAEDAAEVTLDNLQTLQAMGLGLDASDVAAMASFYAEDAAPDLINGGQASGVYIQFLRNFLPGVVGFMTAARKIDELVGVTTAGAWDDEEIVLETMELAGLAVPYSDHGNIPLASYDAEWVKGGVARFELGLQVMKLESARAGRARINSGQRKRAAVSLALNIQRNRVGFYGYNPSESPVYGLLNNPSLPAYATVAATGIGSSTLWSSKSFLQIIGDVREAMGALQVQSGDNIDPRTARLTLAIGTKNAAYLTVTNDFGQSVEGWIKATYPNLRIVSSPEFDNANGGASVFYLYPERIDGEEGSDDNGRVMEQIVPAQMQLLGTEQRAKGFVEDYTNATAGVWVKRPWAVVRRTGI